MNRNLNLLGIAKKAGLLAIGGEAVTTAIRTGKAKLIISASDASERAQRRAKTNAEYGGALHIAVPYTKFELGSITGRGGTGTLAVLDVGLAAGFVKGLAEIDPEHYRETAERLDRKAAAIADKKKMQAKRRTMQ